MMTAKLFENGRSQAVRLPKECRFNGDEVTINKDVLHVCFQYYYIVSNRIKYEFSLCKTAEKEAKNI